MGIGCAAGAARGALAFSAEDGLRLGMAAASHSGAGVGVGTGVGTGAGVVFVKDASEEAQLDDIIAAKQAQVPYLGPI